MIFCFTQMGLETLLELRIARFFKGTGRGSVRPAYSANVWRPGPFRRDLDYRSAVDTPRWVAKSSRKSLPSIPPGVAQTAPNKSAMKV